MQPWVQSGSTAAAAVLQHAVAAALANLHPQPLAARMPQQRDHLPLPVDLAAAAAGVLAGDSGSSKARSSRRQQQQQQQPGCCWDVVGMHGLAGKPLWMCCAQLAVRCLGHLPALSAAAAGVTAAEAGGVTAAEAAGVTAAEAGALALVVPGSAAAGMRQDVDNLEDGLLSCLAHCCCGE